MTSVVGSNVPADAGGPSIPELRGRAIGVVALAAFALGWTALGVTTLPAAGAASVLVVSSTLSVVVVLGAVRVFLQAAASRSRSAAGYRPGGARLVAAVVGAEVVGVILVARVLPLTGHRDVVPVAVCLVVGVHFFPLARLFHVPLYHRTGVALCAVVAATAPLVVLTGRTEMWTLVPGLGAASSLHLTGAAMLRSTRIIIRPPSDGRPHTAIALVAPPPT
jgi:hypothetical protein